MEGAIPAAAAAAADYLRLGEAEGKVLGRSAGMRAWFGFFARVRGRPDGVSVPCVDWGRLAGPLCPGGRGRRGSGWWPTWTGRVEKPRPAAASGMSLLATGMEQKLFSWINLAFTSRLIFF